MPLAVAPALDPAGAGAGFFALVTDVRTGTFSKDVKCLCVEVLAGSVPRGSQVELLHPDGTPTMVVARELREGLGQMVLDLADPHPPKSLIADVTVARTPGLAAPRLPVEDRDTLERLLDSVRASRTRGFPADQVQPVKPVIGLTPEWLCGHLRALPDDAVALLVHRRVRKAMGHHGNPFEIVPDAQTAAMYLAAIGLPEDGDRLLLIAAAAVQGHKSGASLRAAASVGAMGVLATENVVGTSLDLGRRVGFAIGIEMGDAFAKGFEGSVKAAGEEMETLLLAAGRAVGVGWCKGCRDVVELKFGRSGLTGSRELRCPNDNKKADDPLLVCPTDAPSTVTALRAAGR
jgi:hypothetical protein